MQAQEDANMVDAWKNGGEVDGKPVNDARLLAFFKSRRNALSKDDPLWDEWDNRITQYTFAIEESKMSLKWDQHKVSEREMASFYKRWAGKATKNSEFRRTLESSAAKWLTSAKQRASSGSTASKAAAHERWVKNYYQNHVAGGENAQAGLLNIAKFYDAMPDSGTSLADLDPDSAGYGAFMDVYIDGKTNDNEVQNYINDWTREIRKTNPDFEFDKRHIDQLLRRADDGLGTLVRRSVYKTEREDWQERRGDIRHVQNTIEQVPTIKRVFDAQDLFNEELANCHGDPFCGRAAAEKLQGVLAKEGRRLMRGGVAETNVEIAGAIASTNRVLQAALEGKPLDPNKPEGTLTTIFEFQSEGESMSGQVPLVMQMWSIVDGTNAIEAGGWVGYSGVDERGDPVYDDMGNPVYHIEVHGPGELPPSNMTSVVVPDTLVGGPEGVVSYVDATPVSVQPVDPSGEPIDTRNVVPTYTDEAGNVNELDPGSTALYHELVGIVGPDGVARTMYRVGNGTAEKPYHFLTLAPTPLNADGTPARRVGDPAGTGATVYTVPVTVEGEGADTRLTTDLTSYMDVGKAQTTRLPSGALPVGTFMTPEGATTQQAIDELWDTKTPDASKQAIGYIHQMSVLSAQLAATDPARSALLRADAQQGYKINIARTQGVSPSNMNSWWGKENMYDPETQPVMDELAAAGITADKYGAETIAERAAIRAAADEFERTRPYQDFGASMASWARYGVVPPKADGPSAAEQAAKARRQALDPNVSVSDIKLPGVRVPGGGGGVFESLADWFNGTTGAKAPTPAQRGRDWRSYPLDLAPAANLPVGVRPPETYAWEGPDTNTALPPLQQPKPPKPPKPPKENKNPKRPDFSALKAAADVRRSQASEANRQAGTYYSYDPLSSVSTRNAGGRGSF